MHRATTTLHYNRGASPKDKSRRPSRTYTTRPNGKGTRQQRPRPYTTCPSRCHATTNATNTRGQTTLTCKLYTPPRRANNNTTQCQRGETKGPTTIRCQPSYKKESATTTTCGTKYASTKEGRCPTKDNFYTSNNASLPLTPQAV